VEYWIPAESLSLFNEAIRGLIRLENGFFGAAFTGYVPDAFGLKGKDAIAQFVALHQSWEYSTFDVACEISTNRKTVFLNWLFWSRHDFSKFGINQEQREILLGHLKQCWEFTSRCRCRKRWTIDRRTLGDRSTPPGGFVQTRNRRLSHYLAAGFFDPLGSAC